MSWFVKLGKSRSSSVSQTRHSKSPVNYVPFKQNTRPNIYQAQKQQHTPIEFNRFGQVIRKQKQKKNKPPRKNIIFTQNNCFARAVAEYREQQRLKNTTKREMINVIHEADVEQSINLQQTVKQQKHVGFVIPSEGEGNLTEKQRQFKQHHYTNSAQSNKAYKQQTPSLINVSQLYSPGKENNQQFNNNVNSVSPSNKPTLTKSPTEKYKQTFPKLIEFPYNNTITNNNNNITNNNNNNLQKVTTIESSINVTTNEELKKINSDTYKYEMVQTKKIEIIVTKPKENPLDMSQVQFIGLY